MFITLKTASQKSKPERNEKAKGLPNSGVLVSPRRSVMMNIMLERKNETNEIQTSCTHDKNGNMTVLPGLTCKYDAWNRLVEIGNTIRYDYNGLNQRIHKQIFIFQFWE